MFEAKRKNGRPSLLYCGDKQSGKRVAAKLIRDAGFDPVDAGSLRIADITEPFALLVGPTRRRRERWPGVSLPIRAILEIAVTTDGYQKTKKVAHALPARDRPEETRCDNMTALAGWENFYVIVGSSAGALIGLQFVVITLGGDTPIALESGTPAARL